MTNKIQEVFNYSETTPEERFKTLSEIEKTCKDCTKCELSKTRTNVVFSDGIFESKLMIIGEAPGQNEDETGKPFVGRAGKLLDKLLEEHGISRKTNAYICNIVKCRPPENRVPTQSEAEACQVYLNAQISLIRPKIILLVGATAVKYILNIKTPISKTRGEIFEGPYNSMVIPVFHPSYLLRNHSTEENSPRWLTAKDLIKTKKLLSSI